MEQIHPENWATLYFGLIFLITGVQLLVVYTLSGTSNATSGLGLYAVYFMAALLGWIAFALQQGTSVPMVIDVPSVASILNSYILFLAAGQRSGMHGGRYLLGLLCLGACLSVFFVPPEQMFIIQATAATVFFTAAGILSGMRSWRKNNPGDAVIALAGIMMLVGIPVGLYQWLLGEDSSSAYLITFGIYSAAYCLVALGFLASVIIEYQQKVSHLAMEDPLTQLLNRRGMENALHITMAQASRLQSQTSAVLVDIDHFREVNANFGHDVGDQVILQIARVLQRRSRSGDVVARTGGEEFLLVLPDTDVEGARILAERIRADISTGPMIINKQRIPVTVSLGVAGAVGEVDLDNLSREADRAVNLAKSGGHNRVASVENKPVYLSSREQQA